MYKNKHIILFTKLNNGLLFYNIYVKSMSNYELLLDVC